MSYLYTTAIVRYAPDPTSGERLNAGVIVYCRETGFLDWRFVQTYSRFSNAFREFHGLTFLRSLRSAREELRELRETLSSGLFAESARDGLETAVDVSKRVWRDAGLSIQSAAGPIGVANALDDVAPVLFETYVEGQATSSGARSRVTDDDIWEHVRRDLTSRAEAVIRPVTLYVDDTPIEFSRTFRNGKINIIEPVTFDYIDPSDVMARALRLLGEAQTAILAEGDVRMHVIYGMPPYGADPEVRERAENAVRLLKRQLPTDSRLFPHDQAGAAARVISSFVDHADAEVERPELILA